MKSSIYIFGDSWGVGEWTEHKISHKGLEFYLENLGYKVYNYSRPRGSNQDSINKLYQIVKNIRSNDHVLFITTCATRDLSFLTKNNLTDILIKYQGLPFLVDHLLNTCYNNLNKISDDNNLTIQMIGGLNNLDLEILSKYKNLKPAIFSWINLLVKHFVDYHGICDQNKFRILSNPDFTINKVDFSKLEIDFAAKLIEDFHLYQEQNSLVFREDIFRPDGVHPNRVGHEILYKELVKKLNL